LIPPSLAEDERRPKHYIGCLFTSRRYGRGKDGVDAILEATTTAMKDLLNQLEEWKPETGSTHDTPQPGELPQLFMCRINSGKFGVPWARTRAALEGIEIDGRKDGVKQINVISKD